MNVKAVSQTRKGVNSFLSVSFFTLGFVIGNLAGITEAAITIPIISGLFAFIGGSAIAMLQKIRFRDRVTAALLVLTICLGLLAGLYTGLWTRGVFPAQKPPSAVNADRPISGLIRSSRKELAQDFIMRHKKNDWSRETMLEELENLMKDACKEGGPS